MASDMKKSSRALLQAPLTPGEIRWASDLTDKLPDDVDLTFEETKILTRLPIGEWSETLTRKVQDVINIEEFAVEDPDE